ncbi:MAG: hypothetical protein HYU66_25430 [Armatimonadetes bacterium]|nr:hypothetical protein [Armatimonadota bacterium]
MVPRKFAPQLVAAVVLVGLTAWNPSHAVPGLPLLLLALAAAVQSARELCAALSQRGIYPSTAVVSLLVAIALLHAAYFRPGSSDEGLLLAGTIAVAILTLVLVAALQADLKLHGPGRCARDLLVSLLLTVVLGGGYGCALLLITERHFRDPAQGTALVAVAMLLTWLGAAAARLASGLDPRGRAADEEPGRARATVAGDLARVVAAVLGGVAVVRLSALAAVFPAASAAMLGLLVGVSAALAGRAIEAVAARCRVTAFRAPLPHQIAAVQPLYDRLYAAGFVDYAGAFALVFPALYLWLGWCAR